MYLYLYKKGIITHKSFPQGDIANGVITINKAALQDKITVLFPFNPAFVEKIRAVAGRRWHPEEKYWSFPDDNGTLEKILEAFKDEEIQIDPALSISARVDPALQAELSNSSIRQNPTLAKPSHFPTLEKGGEGGFPDKNNSTIVIEHNFEDLRRELVSRKYSYKTVKGYIYYNRDFLSFIKKETADVRESDIKDYLVYLAEEKESATATLNQAINALKFYYGGMWNRSSVYSGITWTCEQQDD